MTTYSDLQAIAAAMAGALEQYELTLKEAADDYEKMMHVFEKAGYMSARREADETCAYIRAMLHARKVALEAYKKFAKTC